MLDADSPIMRVEQDRLNRAVFAKYLADSITDNEDAESLVVGLFGGWGAGKTSMINLIIDELERYSNNRLDEVKPLIVNFSVWSYSGHEALAQSFFRRLATTFENAPHLLYREELVSLIRHYAGFFSPTSPVSETVTKKTWFKEQPKKNTFYRDPNLIKGEINRLLKLQRHKIIITIDNLSRLAGEEIKQVFQIIKSMANYAYTTFIIVMDKDQVVHHLNRLHQYENGEAWINKIVQLPFVIPPILSQDLQSIFSDRLLPLVNKIPIETWDTAYWSNLYYDALRSFFENCRDITHYVNSLNFSFNRVQGVVNPVDFFALTALQIFEPEIYEDLRENKDLLSDLLENTYKLSKGEIQKEKSRCDLILLKAKKVSRETILKLLQQLFPRLNRLYFPDREFFHSDVKARERRRVCSPDLFDVYFRYSIHASQLSSHEFETIMSFNDANLLDQSLSRLNQDGRIMAFLHHLTGNTLKHVTRANTQIIMNALMNNGVLFPKGIMGPLSLSTEKQIHRIVDALLQPFKKEERYLVFENAINYANKSIACVVHELREQWHQHNDSLDELIPLSFRLISLEELTQLCAQTAKKIAEWHETNRLFAHPQLPLLLKAWLEWGNKEDCQRAVYEAMQEDRDLLYFLRAMLAPAIESVKSKQATHPDWHDCLNEIELFIPKNTMEDHAKQLFEHSDFEKLPEDDQLALMIYLDLIGAKTVKTIIDSTSAN